MIHMNTQTTCKPEILIVDDSQMNRDLLSEILGSDYKVTEAEDGVQALAILQKRSVDISLVFLDIVMPNMDGYKVLEEMNKKGWIKDIPVIMISAQNTPFHVEKAYDLGVTDFISRPYEASIVRRRTANTIMLYAKQKKLMELAAEQIYEKEKNSNLMIAILSHIVEFRNGESGLHVLHVQKYTDILLRTLVKLTDRYHLNNADIALITHASALHDIGKISVPDEILNKPGRLTDEEFAVMKGHSMAGAAMLGDLTSYSDEPLVGVAYEIARWHHERFDGRGYPDGLKGDEIPISAQIVALADVYDALTSERVYKKSFSHETAVRMILNGECGAFNPQILECLKQSEDEVRRVSLAEKTVNARSQESIGNVQEILAHAELSGTRRTLRLLDQERTANAFFRTYSDEIQMEYTTAPAMLTLTPATAAHFGLREVIADPFKDSELGRVFSKEDLAVLEHTMQCSAPDDPIREFIFDIRTAGGMQRLRFICQSTWSIGEHPCYTGFLSIAKTIEEG